MKSIIKYLNNKDCIFKYDKQQEPLYEEVFTIFTILTLISSCLLIIIKLFGFLLGILSFHLAVKKAKELPEYSDKLSKILNTTIKCYLITDSQPNAFNAGGKSCYMTTKLFGMLNDKERIAIFLHEYGHYKFNHMIKMFGIEVTFGVLSIATFNVITILLLGDFITPRLGIFVALFISKLFANKFSKLQEFDADKFSSEYGYQKDMVGGLTKMEKWVKKQICAGLKPKECDDAINAMHNNSTHPSFKERFEKILETPTIHKFIFAMAIKPTENLYDTIKSYLKKKWTEIFGKQEVLK